MMQTYLIVSSDTTFIEKTVSHFKTKLNISPYACHEIAPSPSIGIAEVRELQRIFNLKPFGGNNRLVIIKEINKATIPAQNALLKLLEEPPLYTFILLTTSNGHQLLPTVLSRCQLISDNNSLTHELFNTDKTEQLVRQVLSANIGERISLSQNLTKTKEETLVALDALVVTFRHLLYKNENSFPLSPANIANCIAKTLAAKKYVEQNINYKTTLDILFLGFPRSL